MSEKNDPNPETQPVRPTADPTPDAPAPPAPAPSAPDSSADPSSADPSPADPSPVPAAPGQPVKRSLRERFAGTGNRLHSTRGLVGATLAALIVGGVGGAAIHAAVHSDRHEHGPFFRGPGEGRDFGGRMGGGERPGGPGDFFREAPPGFPGPVPPTTTPDDEESPPTPTPSESSNS